MPSVSICIPTYNHAKFIGESLRSAMAQTYDAIEVVVLDNASQDNTQEIVVNIAARDSRVRYVRHSENLGLIGNLNACINIARGKYIKLLCADDSLEPDCVSMMVKILDENPNVSLVGCGRTVTDVNLCALRVTRARSSLEHIPGEKMIAECFFFGNRIGEPTAVMFRRADSMRGFSQSYNQLVDMEMWFHLLCIGDFVALPETLCRIRLHAQQATWTNLQSGQIVADRKRLFLEFVASAGRSAGLLRKWLWDIRMAYAVVRSSSAGYRSVDRSMSEVFYPLAFPRLTYPTVRLMMALGLRLLWRTS